MATSITTHKAVKALQKSVNSLADKLDKEVAKEAAAAKKKAPAKVAAKKSQVISKKSKPKKTK